MHDINSKEYWDNRFATGDWDQNKGDEQSRFFYRMGLELMPKWLKKEILDEGYSICDIGCAEGDGTNVLYDEFFNSDIYAMDFSSSAIELAKNKYPNIQFNVGDIKNIEGEYDIIMSSNTLEHFRKPWSIVNDFVGKSDKYTILILPLNEINRISEHFATFKLETIPLKIQDHMLIHYDILDCSKIENTHWYGEQIILVYASKHIQSKKAHTLGQLITNTFNKASEIEKADFKISVQNLKQELEIYKANEIILLNENIEIKIENNELKLEKDSIYHDNQLLQQINEEIQSAKIEMKKYNALLEEKNRDLFNQKVELNSKLEIKQTEFEHDIALIEAEKSSLEDRMMNQSQYIVQLEAIKHQTEAELAKIVQKNQNVLNEINQISMLKPYRLAHAMRRLKHQFVEGNKQDKKDYIKWMGRKITKKHVDEVKNYNPLEALKNDFNNCLTYKETSMAMPLDEINDTMDEFTKKKLYFTQYIKTSKNENVLKLEKLIRTSEFKGIVVYPTSVKWEPVQRPQHILRELAEDGYLCFFVEPSPEEIANNNIIEEKQAGLYCVHDEAALLYALQIYNPIVLCTWIPQLSWIDVLPQKFVWYEVLDQLEFFSQYDEQYKMRHEKLVLTADFVSYTATNLQKYVKKAKNAKLLPNGVNIKDFTDVVSEKVLQLEKLKHHKIVGYYGAIEEWFDTDIIIELAQKNKDLEIVLIGYVGIDKKVFESYKNIHLLGQIPYNQLFKYANYFDVCIIPFEVNELTNCVSPVKYFEYSALGKPVVSTAIAEMKKYQSEWTLIAKNKNDFMTCIKKALSKEVAEIAKIEGIKLAKDNTWHQRVQVFMNQAPSFAFLKVHANLNRKNVVDVYTPTFLDSEGYNFYAGGAERYLLDLDILCKKIGLNFNIYQYGEYPWVRKLKTLNVVSLGDKVSKTTYSVDEVNRFTKNFYNNSSSSNLAIYSPFFIKGRHANTNSIGISHGVAWDNEFMIDMDADKFWNSNKNIIESGRELSHIVSVDTNTANWFQTVDYEVGKKIKVIPNYVDTQAFTPRDNSVNQDKVIISYPRRLYAARGLYLVLNILDEVLERWPNAEFHFIGRGFKEDTQHVEEKIEKWGDRVKWYSLLPEEMPKAYEISDIVLIPTMYSEGTSLSCLEAMSSGNAVVATRVGGLTDLIIDGYNGKLIDIQEQALFDALEELIDDKETRLKYAKNAIEVAQAFDKERWNGKWEKILKEYAPKQTKDKEQIKELYIKMYLRQEQMKDDECTQIIKAMLEKGHFISVRLDMSQTHLKAQCYGRLQFEDIHSENYYDEPDYVVNETDIVLTDVSTLSMKELVEKINY